jgi:ribonuclease HI
MFSLTPHFLLLTQAQTKQTSLPAQNRGGYWRFILEEIGGSQRIEVKEMEPGIWGERLQLLAVVRGLEALEQPSHVTLITPSRFVGNGIRIHLKNWQEHQWQWEHFGEMIPIKNLDLWQRIDQALKYHQLDCRIWDFDFGGNLLESKHRSESARVREAPKNRITFEQLQHGRDHSRDTSMNRLKSEIRIKPPGSGRAFGYCNASALTSVSYTG